MAKISIIPDNIQFDVSAEQNILEVGLQQALNLPHSCKDGKCGACKCKVVSGDIELVAYKESILSSSEIDAGYTLLCKAYPKTDVILEISNLLNSYPIRFYPAKVSRIEKLDKIALVGFRLPPNRSFLFNPGQYIDIQIDGKTRSYSVANFDKFGNEIEIHVKHYPNGIFSGFVWNQLKVGDLIRFKGPLGTFTISDNNKPLIFVCTGTGFAPIKAILEYLQLNKPSRNVYLYWGNRHEKDFYLKDLVKKYCLELNVEHKFCTSQEHVPGYYKGYVTDAIKSDFIDLKGYEVYACGNLKMIEDIYDITVQILGLNKKNFFSDAFTPSV